MTKKMSGVCGGPNGSCSLNLLVAAALCSTLPHVKRHLNSLSVFKIVLPSVYHPEFHIIIV